MALNKFIWPALAWTVLITVLCLVSMDTFSGVHTFNFRFKDKFVHAAFYFVFTIFWYLFFKGGQNGRNLMLKVFVFAVLYGVAIEICQGMFTTERSADIIDVLANTLGSGMALLMLWLLKKNKN